MECFLGKELGWGNTRIVYEHLYSKNCVVKKIRKRTSDKNANRQEWFNWENATDFERKFMCPVIWISDDFKYLTMKKAIPAYTLYGKFGDLQNFESDKKQIQDSDIFIDDQMINMGIFENRLVMIDYALMKKNN